MWLQSERNGNGYKKDKESEDRGMAFGAISEVLLNAAMRVCCIQGHYSVPQSRCDPRLCDVSSVLFLFLYSTL